MSDNGWPDASEPGVPLHPERDGRHWVQMPGMRPDAGEWSAKYSVWSGACVPMTPAAKLAGWRYLGPCLTPDALDRVRKEAWREGMEEAMRAAASVSDQAADDAEHSTDDARHGVTLAVEAIRARMEEGA